MIVFLDLSIFSLNLFFIYRLNLAASELYLHPSLYIIFDIFANFAHLELDIEYIQDFMKLFQIFPKLSIFSKYFRIISNLDPCNNIVYSFSVL